jgi:hypothetical protein
LEHGNTTCAGTTSIIKKIHCLSIRSSFIHIALFFFA